MNTALGILEILANLANDPLPVGGERRFGDDIRVAFSENNQTSWFHPTGNFNYAPSTVDPDMTCIMATGWLGPIWVATSSLPNLIGTIVHDVSITLPEPKPEPEMAWVPTTTWTVVTYLQTLLSDVQDTFPDDPRATAAMEWLNAAEDAD